MKKTVFTVLLLLGSAAFLSAAPVAEEKGNEIILRNNGAEYKFAKNKFFQLLDSKYKGRSFWVNGFGLTYNLPGDKWYWEDKPCELYKMGARTYKILREGNRLTLATKGEGKHMTLIRNFTLRGDSPDLEVQVRLEINGKNVINWLNLFSTGFPVSDEYWTLVSRVKGGKIVTAMEKIDHPFIDPATQKFYVRGNFQRREYKNKTFVCSYDRKRDVGAVLMQMPEFSRLPLRVGLAQLTSKRAYCNVSPYHFSGTAEKSFLDARFKVVPFTGDPALLNKKVVPEFVAKMQKLYALPQSYETGTCLKNNGTLSVWSDYSSQKVFPDTPAPAKKASYAEVFAAKGEGEGFNLALRSTKEIKNITWETSGFPCKVDIFPVQLTRRDFFGGIIGSHPDVLLEEKSFDLGAKQTSCLYVKYTIPENAKAGVFTGFVKLFSGKEVLAEIPVKLTIWDFSIAERTLTAALDFWWRKYGYAKDKEEYRKQYEKIRKLVVEARGGGRWLAPVQVSFDAQGNLTKADYKNFDTSVKLYTDVYKQPIMITRCFMLGYGHKLRKNLFGDVNEIMTPLWKKKVVSFAKDFRKHLQELKISHRVVMDLFDEPYEDSYEVINRMVTLLREVAPEWRFTYAGNFRAENNGYINFWNTSVSIPRLEADMIKAKKGEYTFYNPSVYSDNGELVKVRAYYNYLWNEKVRYIYQWVINCWAESGNTGWDEDRMASWVVPSPKGPLSTLRLENTREGIEDYEYCTKLQAECARLEKKAPALAAAGKKLLKKAAALNGRSANDEVYMILCNNPAAYEMLHREAGALLEKMAKVK